MMYFALAAVAAPPLAAPLPHVNYRNAMPIRPTVNYRNVTRPRTSNLGALPTVCAMIKEYVPDFCKCKEADVSTSETNWFADLSCKVDVLGLDTLDVYMTFSPCGPPADLDVDVWERALHIHFQHQSGDPNDKTTLFTIPGLSWSVPGLPVSAAATLVFSLEQDWVFPDQDAPISAGVGIDACVTVGGTKCASDVDPDNWPVNIIGFRDKDFRGLCDTHTWPPREHYENPYGDGPPPECLPWETALGVQGMPGALCAPTCNNSQPYDMWEGVCPPVCPRKGVVDANGDKCYHNATAVKAKPTCGLHDAKSGTSYCVLACNYDDGDEACGGLDTGDAICAGVNETHKTGGICTFPIPPPPPPPPGPTPEYCHQAHGDESLCELIYKPCKFCPDAYPNPVCIPPADKCPSAPAPLPSVESPVEA